MDKSLNAFCEESMQKIEEALELLENAEEARDLDIGDETLLEDYAQKMDHIAIEAKSLCLIHKNPALQEMADFTELCKIVSTKATQIDSHSELYSLVIAFLLDATEMIVKLNANLEGKNQRAIQEMASKTFLQRLKWISEKFDKDVSSSLNPDSPSAAGSQDEIDAILKQLGLS